MSIFLLILLPSIDFVLTLIATFILLKYIFKVAIPSVWTIIGILVIGSLFLGFFGDINKWLGIITYVILVGFAFYKKFKLTIPQIIGTLIIVLLIPLATTYLASYLKHGIISKETSQSRSWNLYTSTQDNFKVLFFGLPEVYKISSPIPGGIDEKNFYLTSYSSKLMDKPYYTIAVEEYSLQDIDSTKMGFDAYSALNADMKRRTVGIISNPSLQNTILKGMPAVKFSYNLSDSTKTEGLVVVYKNKFYRLEVTNDIKNWSQVDAGNFINSFELINK